MSQRQGTEGRMPVLFVGHGSPMNIIADNSFTRFLAAEGRTLPKPKVILAISAHWETAGTKVLAVDRPKTIHDFGGFPKALYQVTYPAAGSPETAAAVLDLLAKFPSYRAEADLSWGLDHGTWSILHHLYPAADIPVLQLSMNRRLSLREHFELAEHLKPLRDKGVLLVASGNVTHNLATIDWNEAADPVHWAIEFDELIKSGLERRDLDRLTGKEGGKESLWRQAHPRLDHYVPLLYAVGASDADERPVFPFEGFQNGSLSMRAVRFGGRKAGG